MSVDFQSATLATPANTVKVDAVQTAGVDRQVITIGDRAGGAVDSIGGLIETAPASDTASSGLNGRLQRIAQRLTSQIALWPAALGAGGGLKIDGSGTALPTTDSASKATGNAVPSSAMYSGFDASTALPAAAAAGNIVGAMSDKFGRGVYLPVTIRDLIGTQTTTISASTAETTIVTQAASVFNDLVMLVITNTSAGSNTRIDFRDTTAGTVLFSLQSIGGAQPTGFALPTPIPQTSVNTNWTAQCATSTTDIRIYAVYAKNK